jgi:hypothetical protein
VLIDDQQPIEEFPAQGADHPLADVHSWRLRRAGENPDPFCLEYDVEGGGGLPARSLIRNLAEAEPCPRSLRRVASCLGLSRRRRGSR